MEVWGGSHQSESELFCRAGSNVKGDCLPLREAVCPPPYDKWLKTWRPGSQEGPAYAVCHFRWSCEVSPRQVMCWGLAASFPRSRDHCWAWQIGWDFTTKFPAKRPHSQMSVFFSSPSVLRSWCWLFSVCSEFFLGMCDMLSNSQQSRKYFLSPESIW